MNIKQHHNKRHQSLGRDGLITLIISNAVIFLSLGLSFVWYLKKVYSMAKSSRVSTTDKFFKFILIPGVQLNKNKINSDFVLRLNRAINLYHSSNKKYKLIVIGGISHNNTISEAEAGINYLLSHNIDSSNILLENYSRNTLENFKNTRKLINKESFLMITNRYHLYRASALANGLKLNFLPIAAEDYGEFSLKMAINCIKEAYFVHWYFTGKLWVKITKNKSSYAKIS